MWQLSLLKFILSSLWIIATTTSALRNFFAQCIESSQHIIIQCSNVPLQSANVPLSTPLQSANVPLQSADVLLHDVLYSTDRLSHTYHEVADLA